MKRRRGGRKLLIASVGVAAVSYACGGDTDGGASPDATADVNTFDVVANLVAPDAGEDVNVFDVVANLVAPDAGEDAPDEASDGSPLDVVANLVAPPDADTD